MKYFSERLMFGAFFVWRIFFLLFFLNLRIYWGCIDKKISFYFFIHFFTKDLMTIGTISTQAGNNCLWNHLRDKFWVIFFINKIFLNKLSWNLKFKMWKTNISTKITTKIKVNNQGLVQTSLLGLVIVTHLYAES